jgi:amino acid permease
MQAAFLGLSFAIALSVDDLGAVLAFVGATGSTLVSFVLPGFCYYFLFREEGAAWKRRLALAQGCLGLVVAPLCLAFIFLAERE